MKTASQDPFMLAMGVNPQAVKETVGGAGTEIHGTA